MVGEVEVAAQAGVLRAKLTEIIQSGSLLLNKNLCYNPDGCGSPYRNPDTDPQRNKSSKEELPVNRRKPRTGPGSCVEGHSGRWPRTGVQQPDESVDLPSSGSHTMQQSNA